MAYRIVATVLWIVWHLVFRIKTVGKEKIKGIKQYVLCSNHISAADPMFVVLSRVWEPQMLAMAKEELFQIHPFISAFFRKMGVVPIHRGKGDTQTVDYCISQVKAGKGLLIFPEGTRSKTGVPLKPKSGAFVVAAAADAKLVACRVIYHAGKPKLFSKVTVVYGEPISCAELGLQQEGHHAAGLRQAKSWLSQQWQQMYDQNTTESQKQQDKLRLQQLEIGQSEQHKE